MTNPVDVHNQRAMNSQEAIRIEPPFKFNNRLAEQMDPIADVEAKVVMLRFNPVNVVDIEELDPPPGSNDKP